jgi:hypothetical protein
MTPQRFRREVGILASAVVLVGCAAAVTHAAGRAAPPRGIVFIDGPMVETSHGWVPYRDVRAYRDGRLAATYYHRVLPARDHAPASLLYDESARTARSIRGGAMRPFDPCPGTSGVGNYVELSPSGLQGLCAGEWTSASQGHPLVLFDPRSARTSRRAIFTLRLSGYPPAAWLDERRIAATEYRPACPRGPKGLDDPTGLTIIDRRGRVLERGPCVSSVVAGPRGLVLVQAIGNPARFSTDGGKTWNAGRPRFADADGKVFYQDQRWDDYALYQDGKPTGFRDVHGATWARP